jgi:hypothetical protein
MQKTIRIMRRIRHATDAVTVIIVIIVESLLDPAVFEEVEEAAVPLVVEEVC